MMTKLTSERVKMTAMLGRRERARFMVVIEKDATRGDSTLEGAFLLPKILISEAQHNETAFSCFVPRPHLSTLMVAISGNTIGQPPTISIRPTPTQLRRLAPLLHLEHQPA